MGFDPNNVYGPSSSNVGAPGSSTNVGAAKSADLQILTGYHKVPKGQTGPPGPAYHSLGFLLAKPFKEGKAEVTKLQHKLIAAGFLSEKAVTLGIYDPATIAAYQEALTSAHFYNKMFDAIITDRVEAGAKRVDATTGATFSYQPDDPAKIRRLLNEDLPAIIGHGLSDVETEALVARWQARTQQSARSAFDAQQSGGVASPQPDFETFVQTEAERIDPNGVQANKFGALAAEFHKSLLNRSVETAEF